MAETSRWACTTVSPMGTHESILTLHIDGDTLTGTNASDEGSLDLEKGTVDGNKLTWVMRLTTPMPLKLKTAVEIDGDSMSGTIKAGAFPPSKLTATRL